MTYSHFLEKDIADTKVNPCLSRGYKYRHTNTGKLKTSYQSIRTTSPGERYLSPVLDLVLKYVIPGMSHWQSSLNFSRLNPVTAPLLKNSHATVKPQETWHPLAPESHHTVCPPWWLHPECHQVWWTVWCKAKTRSWNPKWGYKMRALTDLGSSLQAPNMCTWPCFLYRDST